MLLHEIKMSQMIGLIIPKLSTAIERLGLSYFLIPTSFFMSFKFFLAHPWVMPYGLVYLLVIKLVAYTLTIVATNIINRKGKAQGAVTASLVSSSKAEFLLLIWSIYYVLRLWPRAATLRLNNCSVLLETCVFDIILTIFALPIASSRTTNVSELSSAINHMNSTHIRVFILAFLRHTHPSAALILYDSSALIQTLQSEGKSRGGIGSMGVVTHSHVMIHTFIVDTIVSIYDSWASSSLAELFPAQNAEVERSIASLSELMRDDDHAFHSSIDVFRPIRSALFRHLQSGEMDETFRTSEEYRVLGLYCELAGISRVTMSVYIRDFWGQLWTRTLNSISRVRRRRRKRRERIRAMRQHVGGLKRSTPGSKRGHGLKPLSIPGSMIRNRLSGLHGMIPPTPLSDDDKAHVLPSPEQLTDQNDAFIRSYLQLFFHEQDQAPPPAFPPPALSSVRRMLVPVAEVVAEPSPDCVRLTGLRELLTGSAATPSISPAEADTLFTYTATMRGPPISILDLNPFVLRKAVGWPIVAAADGACVAMGLYCDTFQRDAVLDYAADVENLMRPNSYHSNVHVADVVTTLTALLTRPAKKHPDWKPHLRVLVLAAVAHDVSHPGLSNPILRAVSHPASLICRGDSPLERYHSAIAHALLLRRPGIVLDKKAMDLVHYLIVATDPTRTAGLRERLRLPMQEEDDEEELFLAGLTAVLNFIDISNQAKPWCLAQRHAYACCQEFSGAAQIESELGLKSVINSETNLDQQIPGAESAFIRFAIIPLLDDMLVASSTPMCVWDREVLAKLASNAQRNQERWNMAANRGWSFSPPSRSSSYDQIAPSAFPSPLISPEPSDDSDDSCHSHSYIS
eukprot:gnl/Dysnectes_brevis/4856_a6728_581.p1 GENE.gnl/Dysnectes_brevis/4856_a6728_581~~gnl/Dysnectes_brevis/4856_a6728_581.p1  ORF type:complete len:963 (+),score=310.37 gnl/Dysnectes_brevis/4856_a6728_581:327-2891(+)